MHRNLLAPDNEINNVTKVIVFVTLIVTAVENSRVYALMNKVQFVFPFINVRSYSSFD